MLPGIQDAAASAAARAAWTIGVDVDVNGLPGVAAGGEGSLSARMAVAAGFGGLLRSDDLVAIRVRGLGETLEARLDPRRSSRRSRRDAAGSSGNGCLRL